MSQSNRSKHKSILSSLTTLGASQRPVTFHSVARPGVVASVAAAGVSLLACQSADADTITVSNPNVNIGFANGDVSQATLNIGSLALQIARGTNGANHALRLEMTQNNGRLGFKGTSSDGALPAVYGKKFSQVGSEVHHPNRSFAAAAALNVISPSDFSHEYYVFSFTDLSSQTHYGWMYGSVTGGYSNLTYNLISYGYDTTPNVQIGAGYEGAAPEPSTGVMFAMAALILGAAGARRRNKTQV